jgi:hypothetical protein
MKSLRQIWLNQKDAHLQFQFTYQEAAPDRPLLSERQESNYFGSGLMQSQYVTVGTVYELASVRAVAQVLASSGGKERLLYATPEDKWAHLWRLYRRFSDEGAVVLGNTAYVERVTGLPRRTLQRALERGEIPNSRIGNTYFIPLKALEQGRGPGPDGLRTGQLPGQPHFAEPISSRIGGLRYCGQ